MLALLLTLVAAPIRPTDPTPVQALPVAGAEVRYTVRRGDTLPAIARRFRTDPLTLGRLNSIGGGRLKPGRSLLLPGQYILPAAPSEGVVLNLPERAVYVFRKGQLVGRYPVGVGMRAWQTPRGKYRIYSRIKNPVWQTPSEMVRREHDAPAEIGASTRNPLGDTWMGWCEVKSTNSEVGFHATYVIPSVGRTASHACVRLYPECAHRMFDQVYEGMPVYSLYEPAKIGLRDGVYYLSVSPDIYGTGGSSPGAVQARLHAAGLDAFADPAKVARAVARQDGYPWPVTEAGPALEVNGKSASIPTLRTRTGVVMASFGELAKALGGSAKSGADGGFEATCGSRRFVLTSGGRVAQVDGSAVPLETPAVSVGGTLMVPVRAFADLLGASLDYRPGQPLRIATK